MVPIRFCPQLHIGEQLGTGSTGRLFKGKYLSQDVAIKIIEIGDYTGSGTDADTHQSSLAAERLQIYKQEISIMRCESHGAFSVVLLGVANVYLFLGFEDCL